MKKILQHIKRSVGRHVPESIKGPIRRRIRRWRGTPNPTIPIEELEIFKRLNDLSVVFDVGAREDLSLYEIHPHSQYHLFEPNKKAASILREKAARHPDANITINEFGLSDVNADNCVYYEDSQSFAINPFHTDVDTGVRYSLRRLDDYVSEHDIDHINFLKIDAEGFDYKVMLGGIDTIRSNVDYIQFEYWDGVSKFVDILGESFDLYLLMEPRLLSAITGELWDKLSPEQQMCDFASSIIALNGSVIDLIDRVLAPRGWGGNILGVKKDGNLNLVQELSFPVKNL